MSKCPTDSVKSILLDYISPLQITSAYKAFRNGHWAVSASITGFAILKAAIVVSTALLVSSPTPMSEGISILTNTKFDPENIWSNVRGASNNGAASIFPGVGEDIAYDFSSPGPLYAYQGILNGLPNPSGTQDGITFQIISFEETRPNITKVSANVDAFVPKIKCEKARTSLRIIDPSFSPDAPSPLAVATLDSESCSVGHFAFTLTVTICNTELPLVARVNCSEDAPIIGLDYTNFETPQVPIDSKTPYDLRMALFAIDTAAFCSDINATSTDGDGWKDTDPNIRPPNSTAVICKIDYQMTEITLVQDIVQGNLQLGVLETSTPGHQFPNFTGLELGEIMLSLISFWDAGAAFSDVMTKSLSDPSATPDRFLDQETLIDRAQVVLGGIAAQIIQQYAVVPEMNISNGTSIYSEDRLHIQLASLWILVAAFILLTLIAASMLFTLPHQIVPRNPGLVATQAAILASSPSLQALLAKTGHLRTSELTEWLDGHIFKTATTDQGRFEIRAVGTVPLFYKATLPTPNSDEAAIRDHGNHESLGVSLNFQPEDLITKKGKWVPLPGRIPFVIVTIALPIVVIIVLEILFQVSEQHRGLVDTSVGSPSAYARYPTSLIALIVATMINSMDFTVTSFAPFAALRFGSPTAVRSGMLTNILGEIPVVALYQSLRNKQFGAALSTTAALVGSLLTVAASGLWVVDPSTTVATEIHSFMATSWDLRWENSSFNDGGAAAILSIIELGGLNSSNGISKDLVFPFLTKFYGVDKGKVTKPKLSNLTLEVPALRPQLDCELVSPDSFQFEPVSSIHIQLSGIIDLPQGCSAGPDGNHSYATLDNTNFTVEDGSKWIGWLLDLHVGPWDSDPSKRFGDLGEGAISERTGYEQPDNPYGCPSIVIMFAHLDPQKPSTENITGLLCSQKVQQVQTRIVIRSDDTGRINPASLLLKPAPVESTARYLTNGTDGIDSFNYRIEPHLESELVVFNDLTFQSEGLDVFFEQLVLGASRVTLEDIEGPSNVDKLKVAVNSLYQKYMVQVMNTSIFRKNLTAEEQKRQKPITGTTSTRTSRLKVDFASKLVLQIMLTVMALLAGLGLRIAKLRGTLPRNPCSIASMMALVSGSRLCSGGFMPNGAEWMDKQQLAKLYDGHTVGLGWWEGETDECSRGRFGIDLGRPNGSNN
ncbi:hypothetical protein F4680DRAFT_465470 [Xylaria scruposa]|nr:hypothetical protein F4680DRAFT_465470 [Xylaria scruposa]